MILPILMALLLGVFEIGLGIASNQKTIRAAQIAADLLSRERVVADTDLSEAMEAARQAILPLDTSEFGVDIISVEFIDAGSGNMNTQTLWRETQNMSPDTTIIDDVQGLGAVGEGVLAVVITNIYRPKFSSFAFGDINMREIAIVRSRKGSIITRSNNNGA